MTDHDRHYESMEGSGFMMTLQVAQAELQEPDKKDRATH